MTSVSGIPLKIVLHAAFGIKTVQEILYSLVDSQTALFLSGGRTPRDLYVSLTLDKKLHPGAVALVDERYGQVSHEFSNERMIRETGLWDYFFKNNVPAHGILKENVPFGETTKAYEETLLDLFKHFSKRVAILGIGLDGHTAGLPALNAKVSLRSQASKVQNSKVYNTKKLVVCYHDASGEYGERITLTFRALAMIDFLIILVFGEDKKNALKLMVQEGSEEEIPARFFRRPEIAKKTLLITDQKI